MPVLGGFNTHNEARAMPPTAPWACWKLVYVRTRAFVGGSPDGHIDAVDVNKRWSDCKRAASLGKIRVCRGTRSSVGQLWKRGQRRCYRLKGSAATDPFL